MIIIKITGPRAVGKTTLANQLRRMLQQEGLTLRERIAFWLLKKSSWNKFKIKAGEMHTVEEATESLIQNLRAARVKVLIWDGGY